MSFSKYLITIFFLILLLGCSVHNTREASLSTDIPRQYKKGGANFPPGQAREKWWEVFRDEELNLLMEKTFSGNLDLEMAYSRLEQLEATARQKGSVRYPSLNLKGSSSRSRQLASPESVTGNAHSLSLEATFEVDIWNRLKSAHKAGVLEKEASMEDIRSLYLTLSARVADLYYLMVEQRARLELTDRTVAAREDTLKLVESRYREGSVSALDVYQARQTLASVRSGRPQIETSLSETAHSLSILLGEYPDSAKGGDLRELPAAPELFSVGLPSDLLLRRPDIRRELLKLQARDMEIGVAVAERFPSVNLLANFGTSESNFGPSLSGAVWSLAGNMLMPVIDWGNRKAGVTRAEAIYREQLAGYRLTVLNAFKEVEDSLVGNINSEKSIKLLEEEVESAEAALALSTDRYMDGLSDYLPVLTAQALCFDARGRLITAKRELISKRVGLARALGGSWMDGEIDKLLTVKNRGE